MTDTDINNNLFYSKTFFWLFLGVLTTFGTGYLLYLNEEILFTLGQYIWGIFILEVVSVLLLTRLLPKINTIIAKIFYFAHTILTGVTFGMIFYVFELQSIIYVFALTSVIFIVMAMFGKFTKLPIYKLGTFLLISLICLIIMGIVGIFIKSETFNLMYILIGIGIFIIYIAYDVHIMPAIKEEYGEEKGAIYAALQLYLDFINLFIRLLELLGKSKD